MAAATNNIMAIPAAHFSHPTHELKLRESYHLPRHCDLCGEKLTGSGYSCPHRHCNFNLHEECARYPETLRSFFAHPCHDLTLSRTDGQSTSCCRLCRVKVPAGVFVYRCAPCRFAVHPRCSRLPQTAHSDEVHPDHDLSLTAVPSAGAPCAACRKPCGVWVYRCAPCDIDLHMECLHGARSSRGKNQKEGPSSLGGQVMEVFNDVMSGVEAFNNFMKLSNNVTELAEAAMNPDDENPDDENPDENPDDENPDEDPDEENPDDENPDEDPDDENPDDENPDDENPDEDPDDENPDDENPDDENP